MLLIYKMVDNTMEFMPRKGDWNWLPSFLQAGAVEKKKQNKYSKFDTSKSMYYQGHKSIGYLREINSDFNWFAIVQCDRWKGQRISKSIIDKTVDCICQIFVARWSLELGTFTNDSSSIRETFIIDMTLVLEISHKYFSK